MPRKPRTVQAAKAAPQFDEAPLADDEEEGACPIPDDDGNIVLRRSKPATKGVKRGKGKDDKPAR
jgi:hypothetical protein